MKRTAFLISYLLIQFTMHVNAEIMYNCDSTIITNESHENVKTVNKYDPEGNATLQLTYFWNNVSGIWEISQKVESLYDSNNITNEITYSWNENSKSWEKANKKIYEYENDGKQTLYVNYTWDYNTLSWKESEKTEYVYDNNIQTHLDFYWDNEIKFWRKSFKSEYLFNTNGDLIARTNFSWDHNNSIYIVTYKTEYVYDSNNALISETSSTFYDSIWIYWNKTEYIYNSNGNNIVETRYSWDENTSSWERNGKYENTYNEVGNIEVTSAYDYNSITSEWEITNKYENVYDETGYITAYNIYNWDSANSLWNLTLGINMYYSYTPIYFAKEGNSETILIYSTDLWTATVNVPWISVSPDSGNGVCNIAVSAEANNTEQTRTGIITITSNENIFLKNAIIKTIKVIQKSDNETTVETIDSNKTLIYPNPATSYFKINTDNEASILVYSIKGELLINIPHYNNESIATNNLVCGTYIIKIASKNVVTTQTLIVK